MKRTTILFFFILVMVCNSFANTELRIIESMAMPSRILKQDVHFSICLPMAYYKSEQSFPVVYLLHGLGGDETSWLEYGHISQIADKAVEDGEIAPMIFVMPEAFRTYYVNDYAGTFRYQDMFIQELIPFIDNHYRTMADNKHRATLGYSMGGFGALILPLKNPDIISTCVPLSISIRTDEQYMFEDASEWDKQWGSLFGGVGKTGNDRITEYYKQNSPLHIFLEDDLSRLSELKIYIDNGDDEQTLCRSNEELHILLRDREFPHEYRVRNGGHEFSYWRDALPNALRFISDAFEGKAYRGDLIISEYTTEAPFSSLQSIKIKNSLHYVYVPHEYNMTNRAYPAIYFIGNFQKDEEETISGIINERIEDASLPPMIAVFISEGAISLEEDFFKPLEKEFRIRQGFRFRAIVGFEKGGATSIKQGLNPECFSSCVIFDASFDEEELQKTLIGITPKSLKRTWFFIAVPDKSMNYKENGSLHIQFRDQAIYHEYRVSEGKSGFEWLLNKLPETLTFIANKIHN